MRMNIDKPFRTGNCSVEMLFITTLQIHKNIPEYLIELYILRYTLITILQFRGLPQTFNFVFST